MRSSPSLCLNPYFIGLSILIIEYMRVICNYQMSQSLFYWIIYSYIGKGSRLRATYGKSQSLFYWIIYSYFIMKLLLLMAIMQSQSLFYWIIYSYAVDYLSDAKYGSKSQSLFYWIFYSYWKDKYKRSSLLWGLNPYFIGLSILIAGGIALGYLIVVSILILLDYLFLYLLY